jgi:hypothetical protein
LNSQGKSHDLIFSAMSLNNYKVHPVNEHGEDFIQILGLAHGVLFATGELVYVQGPRNKPGEAVPLNSGIKRDPHGPNITNLAAVLSLSVLICRMNQLYSGFLERRSDK